MMPWMSLMRTGKMKRQSYTISTCICPDCGLKFPISRKKAEAREKGHHKYIWCPNCKERKNFEEYRCNDYEPYIYEC